MDPRLQPPPNQRSRLNAFLDQLYGSPALRKKVSDFIKAATDDGSDEWELVRINDETVDDERTELRIDKMYDPVFERKVYDEYIGTYPQIPLVALELTTLDDNDRVERLKLAPSGTYIFPAPRDEKIMVVNSNTGFNFDIEHPNNETLCPCFVRISDTEKLFGFTLNEKVYIFLSDFSSNPVSNLGHLSDCPPVQIIHLGSQFYGYLIRQRHGEPRVFIPNFGANGILLVDYEESKVFDQEIAVPYYL